MSERQRYKVRPAPGLHDESGLTYFAVIGPRVDEFSHMRKIAKLLEKTLNAADEYATQRERGHD